MMSSNNKEKLSIKYLSAKDLRPLEGNPRKVVDPEGIRRLVGLIREHGFQNPLQVFKEDSEGFVILCGNHRFRAGQEMGMTSFPCIEYKGTRAEAMARAVSDNKSGEYTDWDVPALKDLLVELDDGEFDLELTGFSDDEIKSLFDESEPVTKNHGSLSDQFLIPPFSVLNARDKWWQDRKRFWRDQGIESELGRDGCPAGGGAFPAADQSGTLAMSGGKSVRGDGRGRRTK